MYIASICNHIVMCSDAHRKTCPLCKREAVAYSADGVTGQWRTGACWQALLWPFAHQDAVDAYRGRVIACKLKAGSTAILWQAL